MQQVFAVGLEDVLEVHLVIRSTVCVCREAKQTPSVEHGERQGRTGGVLTKRWTAAAAASHPVCFFSASSLSMTSSEQNSNMPSRLPARTTSRTRWSVWCGPAVFVCCWACCCCWLISGSSCHRAAVSSLSQALHTVSRGRAAAGLQRQLVAAVTLQPPRWAICWACMLCRGALRGWLDDKWMNKCFRTFYVHRRREIRAYWGCNACATRETPPTLLPEAAKVIEALGRCFMRWLSLRTTLLAVFFRLSGT